MAREPIAPFGEIDQFGNHRGEAVQLVEFAGTLGGVAAGDQNAAGAADVQAFAAGLDSHSKAGEAGFEAHLVGDDAFQGGDIGTAIAIHIEADGEVEAGLRAQKAMEREYAECGIRRGDRGPVGPGPAR